MIEAAALSISKSIPAGNGLGQTVSISAYANPQRALKVLRETGTRPLPPDRPTTAHRLKALGKEKGSTVTVNNRVLKAAATNNTGKKGGRAAQ